MSSRNDAAKLDATIQEGMVHCLEDIPLLPVLPSQLFESYNRTSPPAHFSHENITNPSQTGSFLGDQIYSEHYPGYTLRDTDFAAVANDLVNETLDRTPTGGSVVDPDSVIGESHRLYHGYKEGKYILPNDARIPQSTDCVIVHAKQDRLDLQHELFRIIWKLLMIT
ncbi:hypothetical protein BX600DRAFT_438076 [Xylariales sp. PMI_506]|nr:hypothetical protein BX600DRAFT_438076 [Xylariales sp. PMI_506]